MSGGARYWNEETQRWEDAAGPGTAPTPVTPPPPARPGFAPRDPGVGTGSVGGEETVRGEDPASGAAASPDGPAPAAVSPSPAPTPPPAPVGWPGSGGQNGWHSPVGAGAAAADVAWSPTEVSGQGPALSQSGGGGDGAWPATTWPPAGQPAVPAPARGMSRRLVWSVVAGAAAVGVAVSLVLTLVVSGDDKDKPSVAASGSESSPPAEVSQQSDPAPTDTEETASPSPSTSALPAGWEWYEDREGFRIARPEGWTRGTKASQFGMAVVNYRSADREHRLQIYQVAEESPAASFDLFLSDQTVKAAGFREISLDTLDDGEFIGSRLEYTADSIKGEPDIGTWHVYDERFVAADGSIYAIAAYGPDANGGEDELELLTTAVDHFCPPYACDPAAID
ncbi:hypothetical protein ABZ027_15315 [Streptomyces sp. NPDC006332]|uniref:hypothetical protein n=1 Tax=Streptomyces sp. NPDC006332 TaxID=3155456 RepID=UPI0033A0FEAE